MRAINHALTGAIIGVTVGQPLAAVPAAVVSHYLLDALPHHGTNKKNIPKFLRSIQFRRLLYADAVFCFCLVLVLFFDRPQHWLLAAVCAFAAAAPDFLSFNRYRKAVANKRWQHGWYTSFASRIQWFERPIGAAVELAWFIAASVVLLPFLR